jgi:transcriptional regulator with XRE-family HTH domain
MSQEDIYINGDLLRLRREASGWVINDMATRACLSVKQVRQLEDGGMSSFYSQSVKATAAKKVGAILGLSPEEVLAESVEPSQEPEAIETELVQHAEDKDPVVTNAAVAPDTLPEAVDPQVEAPVHVVKKPALAPIAEEPKSKSSLWLIAGLFAAALAVAAYMQPREEPASEPAPPLQVLPSEDPASPASAADVSASAPVEGASMAALEASSPRLAASVAAPITARSASPSTVVSAPAAAASKAP